MRFILKWGAIALAGLMLLVIVAALLLPKVINPNNYRADISNLVYDKTGLVLKINGPITWSFFPWLGLSIENLTLLGSDNSQLATLNHAEISVKLLPLLTKNLEVKKARLSGLDLELVHNINGQNNWETKQLKSYNSNSGASSSTSKKTNSIEIKNEDKEHKLQSFNIAGVEVTGLTLNYDNRVTGNFYTIDKADFTTGAMKNNKPFDIKLNAILSSKKPDITFHSDIYATVSIDLKNNSYDVKNIVATVNPNAINGEKIHVKGNVSLQEIPFLVQGNLNIAPFNIRHFSSQIGMPLPPMISDNAMENISFSSKFKANNKQLDMSSLNLMIDNFKMSGFFNISDFNHKAINFNLVGDDLYLDKYMLVMNSTHNNKSTAAHRKMNNVVSKNKEIMLIPGSIVKNFNINGSLKLTSLIVNKMKFGNPTIKVSSQNSSSSNINIHSTFYKGNINVTGRIDANTLDEPKLNAKAQLKGINLHLMSLSVQELKSIEGLLNADVNIKTRGLLKNELLKNMGGKINFNIEKGAFTKVNFNKIICEGVARVRKKKMQKREWVPYTQFNNLSGSISINNGIATNKDLRAILKSFNLKGDGQLNLLDQMLDYHIGLNIRGSESVDSDPACHINKDYRNITWPIHCYGKLGQNKCVIDMQRLSKTAGGIAKKELENKINKEIDKHLDGNLKKAFKNLFN